MTPPILTLHTVQKTTGEAGTLSQYRAEVSQLLLDHSVNGHVTVTPDLFEWLAMERPSHQTVSRAPGQEWHRLTLHWPCEGMTIGVCLGGTPAAVNERALQGAWQQYDPSVPFPGVKEATVAFVASDKRGQL